jgi:DNA-binding transcriptional LysR family regulator
MELYQLRGFAAVAEQGHLTRAADLLHLSQPALSAQIRALEDELGVELFERHAAGMGLTPAGRQLLASAHDVIAAAQALRSKARALGGEVQGTVRMGTVADPAFVRLPQVLLGAAQRFPLLDVEVTQQVSGEAFARVRDGRLDASFYFGDLADPAVDAVELHRFDFVVVAPRAWRGRVVGAAFEALAAQPWILTPPASTLRVLCDAEFARHGISPVTRVSADNEDVVRALVVAGLGLALMRDADAQALAAQGKVAVWDGPRLPCSLSFLWNQARADEPAVRAIVELASAAWRTDAPVDAPGPATPASRRTRARSRASD